MLKTLLTGVAIVILIIAAPYILTFFLVIMLPGMMILGTMWFVCRLFVSFFF
ncbi:MAG: hypothetical protein ACK4XY_06355 [Chloroherpetonaceae bacterium]